MFFFFFFFFFLRSDPQRRDSCNGMVIILIGPVFAQIWSFEAIKEVSTLCIDDFSILKGLKKGNLNFGLC